MDFQTFQATNMAFSSLPNVLSILRIILTVPIVISLLNHQFFLALGLFFIAGISDALDGWYAKRFGFQTRLGSILDPVADKLLLIGSFAGLFWIGLLPFWLLVLVFLRDTVIVAGTVGYFLGTDNTSGDKLLTPSNLSKINTVLQIGLVLLLILSQIYHVIDIWMDGLIVVVATSTALSGADYMWIWIKKVMQQEKPE